MTQKTKTILVGFLALGAIALFFLQVNRFQSDYSDNIFALSSPSQSLPAPNFTLRDAQTGQSVNLLNAARNGPVVLDFWAIWCGHCREESPVISALAQEFSGKVQFYGVDSSDSAASIRTFSSMYPMQYTTLVDAHHVAAMEYNSDAIPRLVLIDTHGRVRLTVVGYYSAMPLKKNLSSDLKTILRGNS